MKNHRFPWLRNRTTDNRKCEKARNIKEKRTIEMFNTVSKQLVELLSSASDNIKKIDISKAPSFRGFFNVKIRILKIARCFIEIQNSLILFGYMLKKILWLNKI